MDEKDVKKVKVTVKRKKKAKTGEQEPLTKKQELNNHIVSMRKAVRKGRVHLINKLVRDVEKLKERKGDEKSQEKAKRKAERLVQEIHIIKHLKEDKVSIYALQNTKNLAETVGNIQSTTEERSLARLSFTVPVQREVTQYRESNPYWELQIPVLLERNKDKRRKINKKLLEREALKGLKEVKIKPQEDEEQTAPQSDASDNSDSEEIAIKGEEDSEDNDTLAADPEKSKSKLLQPKLATVSVDSKNIPKSLASKQNKTIKPDKKRKAESKIGKSQGSIRVQVLNNLTDLNESDQLKVNLTTDNIDEAPKKKPKSSFFVGGEDDKSKIPEAPRPQPDKPRKERRALLHSSAEFKPIFRKGKLVNKGPKSFKTDHQPKRNSYFQGGQESGSSNLTPLGNKSFTKSEGLDRSSKSSSALSSGAAEKLHPSWEAKKRQQPALADFKGKKITFNDDD